MWLRDAALREKLPHDRASSTTPSTSRTAGARRSGRTSPAAAATRSSRGCSALGAGDAATTRRSEQVARRRRRSSSRRTGTRRSASVPARSLDGRASRELEAARRDRRRDETRRRAQRRAGAQPGRALARLPLRAGRCSRSTSSSPTRRPAESCASSPAPRPIRTSSSLQFIHSAGAWDAAQPAARGRHGDQRAGPALAIYDALERRNEREIQLRDVDEIFEPTWAPDGQRDAFTGDARRPDRPVRLRPAARTSCGALTNDAFADLQPAWSPDGRRIAFVTDRFTTRLEPRCPSGPIGWRVDRRRRSGRVDRVLRRAAARTSTRSGRRTAARSTSSPIATASRTSTASRSAERRTSQVTDVGTGVSGITAPQPRAVGGVAARARVAFTVYQRRQIQHLRARRTCTAGTAARGHGRSAAAHAAAARTAQQRRGRRRSSTTRPRASAAATAYPVEPIQARTLSLDDVASRRFARRRRAASAPSVGGGVSLAVQRHAGQPHRSSPRSRSTRRRPASASRTSARRSAT